MITNDSQAKFRYLVDLIEKIMPLKKWNFSLQTSFAGTPNPNVDLVYDGEKGPYVIYDSEYCRVKFSLEYSGYGRSSNLWVLYGRLHAPDDAGMMQ